MTMRKWAIILGFAGTIMAMGCTQDYRASLASDMTALELSGDMVLGLRIAGDEWVAEKEAPAGLIDETAEHLEHEIAEKGQTATPAQLREAARKRLQINEAFLINKVTGAHLDVDISRIGENEKGPSSAGVKDSARYAASSLEGEEGVSDLVFDVRKVQFPGTQVAYKLSADYKLHGEPQRFIGIIAFASPYWVYLYYTDPQKNQSDYGQMEQMLQSAVLVSKKGA